MASMIHRHLLEIAETVAATTVKSPNHTADVEISQTNFDTNMVIILAALLCALVCALGLNSIVRCALRCSGRETEEQAAARISATGLKKSVLRKIPIHVYGMEHEGSGSLSPGAECPICLGEFVDGDKVRVLPKCYHGFHVRCIDTWLGSHSSCPNCRHSVVEAASSAKAEAAPQHDGGVDGGGGEGRQEHVVVEMSGLGS